MKSIDFEKLAVTCLQAFAKGDYFRYHINQEGPYREAKRVHQVVLTLKRLEDAEVLEVLSKVGKGYLNFFVKHILKWYLSAPIPNIIINEKDSAYFREKGILRFGEVPVIEYTERVSYKQKKYMRRTACNTDIDVMAHIGNSPDDVCAETTNRSKKSSSINPAATIMNDADVNSKIQISNNKTQFEDDLMAMFMEMTAINEE